MLSCYSKSSYYFYYINRISTFGFTTQRDTLGGIMKDWISESLDRWTVGLFVAWVAWVVLMLIVLFTPILGYCDEHQVTTQWEYPDPPTDLAGFLLYREIDGDVEGELSANVTVVGSFVSLVDGNATYSHTGLLEMSDGPNVFRLEAYDCAGQVSPISEPAGYDPAPGKQPGFILLMFQPK